MAPDTFTQATSGDSPLWDHQAKAIAEAGNRHALFFDPGCGKSRTVIELLKKAIRANPIYKRVLIFAPLNVCRNWENELDKYFGASFACYIIAGQTKYKKLEILEEFCAAALDRHLILICNIESLRSDDYLTPLMGSKSSFIIVDESHNFKSPTSHQTKGLLNLIDYLKPMHLYLLTGTPAPQGEIDLYTTFRLLGKTADTFFVWRRKYFADKNERRRGMRNYWPDYQITEKGKAYFQALLQSCSHTANKNLVLDLPPLIKTCLYTELGREQANAYKTMLEYLFVVDAEGNELNASNFLSRSLRLQQIIAGFVGDIVIKNNQRMVVLKDAIQKVGSEQFIIWTIFQPTYRAISDLLTESEISHGFLTGEQSAEERFEFMNSFQAGEIKALIAHPKAGGVGVNLTAASYSIHYTRSFSLTDDLQAEARNYRGGSEMHERITRIDIVAAKTIDEDIVKALHEKKSVQEFILGLKEKHGKGR